MHVLASLKQGIRRYIRALARLLNRRTGGRLTPNEVTTIGVVMHLPIALLIALGSFIWAAILLVIFGLFDVLDGELARLQNRANARGMLFDASTDRVKEVALYTGIAYFLSRGPYAHWTYLAVIACGASLCVSYIKAKGEAALSLKRKVQDHHTLNRYFHDGLAPFEVRMSIIVIGLLLNQLLAATALVAVLATITALGRLKTISQEL